MLRLRSFRTALTAYLTLLLLTGCGDEPAGPRGTAGPRVTAPATAPATGSEREPVQEPTAGAFSVDLEVDGPLTPGVEIPITVTLTAHSELQRTDVRLSSPELDAAARTSWSESYRIRPGTRAATLAEASVSPPAYGSVSFSTSVVIPAEGAYQLIAVGRAEGVRSVRPVNRTVMGSIWLYIDEAGGSSSLEFEPARLGAGKVEIPGPVRALAGGGPASVSGPQRSGSWGGAHVQLYYSDDDAVTQVVSGSLVEIQEYATIGGPILNTQYALTDSNGVASFTCTQPWIDIYPHLWGSEVKNISLTDHSAYCVTPADTFSISKAQVAHGFMRLEHVMAPTIEAAFAETRGVVDLKWYPGGTGTCSYSSSSDEINLNPGCLFDDYGEMTLAHEFGHAFHKVALGGFESGTCGGNHYKDLETNWSCAWAEGFAEYVAASTGFDAGFNDSDDVQNHCVNYSCSLTGGPDHLAVEGAVMAFLNDVTDGDNSESYDSFSITKAQLADIVQTCEVKIGPAWIRPSTIFWVINCLQREIQGYDGEGFPWALEPADFSVTSGHSVTANDVKRLWRWHFMNETVVDPPTPDPPVVSLTGPDEVKPSTSCTWWVSATGSDPFTYQWYKDSSPVGAGDDEALISTGTTAFEVRIFVTDNAGQVGADTISVSVSSGADICFT